MVAKFFTPAVFACTAFALAFTAPAVAQNGDNAALFGRLDKVERDLRDLRGQVFRGGGGSAPAPATAGAGANTDYVIQRLDQLEEEVRRLTGKLEESQFANDQVTQRLERLSNDVDFRLKALEGNKAPGGAPAPMPDAAPPSGSQAPATPLGAAKAPGDPFRSPPAGNLGTMPAGQPSVLPPVAPTNQAPAPAASALPGASPEEKYNYAFSLMRQGDYPGAEVAFKQFIAEFPKHDRAGNASYWLAESFYVRGNYVSAAQSYLETLQTYGQTAKGPDAMLKLGMTLNLLNQKAEACQTFKALPGKYPKAESSLKDRAKQEAQKAKCS